MKVMVTLHHCSRPHDEVILRAELFKERLLEMSCPEQIFKLRHSFLRANEHGQRDHEWTRIYQTAFSNAAGNTKKCENKQWYFEVSIK